MSLAYICVTLMGIVGIVSLLLFLNFYIRFIKISKSNKKFKKVLILNWSLLLISVVSFILTFYFIMDIREQLFLIL